MVMKEHVFTLVLTADPNEDEADKMYATFNDGTISTIAGVPQIHFHREAGSLEEAIRSAIAGFSVDIARLEAQSQGKDKVIFPEGFEEKYPRLVEEARNIFQSRRRQLKSTLSGLDEEIFQRSRDITSAEQQITNGAESLELLQKQLDLIFRRKPFFRDFLHFLLQ
jgi:hypothetical protein